MSKDRPPDCDDTTRKKDTAEQIPKITDDAAIVHQSDKEAIDGITSAQPQARENGVAAHKITGFQQTKPQSTIKKVLKPTPPINGGSPPTGRDYKRMYENLKRSFKELKETNEAKSKQALTAYNNLSAQHTEQISLLKESHTAMQAQSQNDIAKIKECYQNKLNEMEEAMSTQCEANENIIARSESLKPKKMSC